MAGGGNFKIVVKGQVKIAYKADYVEEQFLKLLKIIDENVTPDFARWGQVFIILSWQGTLRTITDFQKYINSLREMTRRYFVVSVIDYELNYFENSEV